MEKIIKSDKKNNIIVTGDMSKIGDLAIAYVEKKKINMIEMYCYIDNMHAWIDFISISSCKNNTEDKYLKLRKEILAKIMTTRGLINDLLKSLEIIDNISIRIRKFDK